MSYPLITFLYIKIALAKAVLEVESAYITPILVLVVPPA